MGKAKKGPSHPIGTVKQLASSQLKNLSGAFVDFDPKVYGTAMRDFGWGPTEILEAILRLNCRDYAANPKRNHFHKTEPHRGHPGTSAMMDYYKARNINGFDIYTHLAIVDGRLEISSFKDLNSKTP